MLCVESEPFEVVARLKAIVITMVWSGWAMREGGKDDGTNDTWVAYGRAFLRSQDVLPKQTFLLHRHVTVEPQPTFSVSPHLHVLRPQHPTLFQHSLQTSPQKPH